MDNETFENVLDFFTRDSIGYDDRVTLIPQCDLPDMTFLSYEDRAADFWMKGVLTPCVACFGIIGNLLTIFILSRPQMISSIHIVLVGMAIADTVVLITAILMLVLPTLCVFGFILQPCWFVINLVPWTYFLGMSAQTSSTYLTIAVTVERYIAVCHPLKARYWWSTTKAKVIVGSVLIFAIIYNVPRCFETTARTANHPERDECFPVLGKSELRQNPLYVTVYIAWMYFLVMYVIPLVSLAVLNFKIYRQISRSTKERSTLTRSQMKEINLTTMLFGVVIVFFLCNLLAFLNNILEHMDVSIDPLIRTADFLVTTNSSVNVVIYCVFGAKFQKLVMAYFRSWFLCDSSPDLHRVNTVYRTTSKRSETTILCLLPEESRV